MNFALTLNAGQVSTVDFGAQPGSGLQPVFGEESSSPLLLIVGIFLWPWASAWVLRQAYGIKKRHFKNPLLLMDSDFLSHILSVFIKDFSILKNLSLTSLNRRESYFPLPYTGEGKGEGF